MTGICLLDLTRTLRRVGRTVTGVDRVERAYLAHLLADEVPLFGLVRTPFGYLLLDSEGLKEFEDRLSGAGQWGAADLMSRLTRGRGTLLQQAESDLRRGALARCSPLGLRRTLARHLGAGFCYYNVGHSNLSDRVLRSVKSARGEVQVLVHDVIPLEHPQFQRPGSVDPFKDKLARVSEYADRVIYNSEDTRRRAEKQLSDLGRVPPGIVSKLGTITPVPDPRGLPADLPPDRPFFITVGTLEPRKNHAFLLDLWERMGPDAPPLLICGSRGWENADVFARLDALQGRSAVREVPDLGDAAVAALVQKAAGALYPTHAEGFGLPLVEARAFGTRVLCNDLTVLREILGDQATYVSVNRPDIWVNTLRQWEKDQSVQQMDNAFEGYRWSDHFKTVLRLK